MYLDIYFNLFRQFEAILGIKKNLKAMKLFIIPVRVLDLPSTLIKKLIDKTFTVKVRTHNQKTFSFKSSDCKMRNTDDVLQFIVALHGYGAKDIDRFFFLSEKDELLYVSRPGMAMKKELEKLYIGEAL